jgi:hypothetical protein
MTPRRRRIVTWRAEARPTKKVDAVVVWASAKKTANTQHTASNFSFNRACISGGSLRPSCAT